MTAVEDEVLSAQTGQDGISIALNVKAHIDSFQWIDTYAAGAQLLSKTSQLVAAL